MLSESTLITRFKTLKEILIKMKTKVERRPKLKYGPTLTERLIIIEQISWLGHINANSIASYKFNEIKAWLLSAGRLDVSISTLFSLLDKHAPVMKKTNKVSPRVPWFNDEIKLAKQLRRKEERI